MNWVRSTTPPRPGRAGRADASREDRRRNTRPRTGGQDRGRGRGHHTQGGPPPNLGAARADSGVTRRAARAYQPLSQGQPPDGSEPPHEGEDNLG